jgi:glycosyltransferase involved in cell wall biosynthesis
MPSTVQEPPPIAIVLPCYNEQDRLDRETLVRFARAHPEIGFVLVDDGSTDGTLACLEQMREEAGERVQIVHLARNRGKAEAVRVGMLRAFEKGCAMAGYWDADLATPLDEIPRFADVLRGSPGYLAVFGARVQLLGRSIERRAARHYLGRVFATTASALLDLPIYDTQCGAKLFRVTDETRALFAEPFTAGWTFDVELIARLIRLQRQRGGRPAKELIYELPLETWHDVPGSKVSTLDFARALSDVIRIRHRYLRRRAPKLPENDG